MKKRRDYQLMMEYVLVIVLSLFAIFISYQILVKIFGGSWATESIVIALVVFNIGLTFAISSSLSKLRSDHSHLSTQFRSLARDFKQLKVDVNQLKADNNGFSTQLKGLANDFKRFIKKSSQ